jgi:hypothetical protein
VDNRDTADESVVEPRIYLVAASGLLLILALETRLGLPAPLALVFTCLLVVVSIAAARIRAEVGAPIHDFSNLGPDFVIPALAPPGSLSPAALGALTLNHWFAETTRANIAAVGAENFRIGKRVNARPGTVIRSMIGGAAFATVVFIVYYLSVAYRYGALAGMQGYSAAGMSSRSMTHLLGWLNGQGSVGAASWAAIGVGALVAYGLQVARCVMPAWPLHAAGFALSSQWAGTMLWGSFLVAWAVKLCLLRAGGLKLYRRAVPFMMGLVAAYLLVGVSWAMGDMFLGRPIYGFCDH